MQKAIAHWHLIAWGVAVFLTGLGLWWRSGRYDLKGKAIDTAWDVARGRRSAAAPTALEQEWADIAGQQGVRRKATRAAVKVIGHFVWQVLGLVGIAAMCIGAGLVAWPFLAG